MWQSICVSVGQLTHRTKQVSARVIKICAKMSAHPSSKVWVRFERKTRDGKVLKLRIQDLPNDRKEEAIEMFHKYFLPEEPVSKSYKSNLDIVYDEEAKAEELESWNDTLRSSLISICCLDDPDAVGEIMAISVSYIIKRDEPKYVNSMKSEAARKVLDLALDIHAKYDVFDVFKDIQSYLDDLGIAVHPKYRGLGICGELLKARRLQCKALNVDMTGAWMTSAATQRAAERDGWQVAAELSFQDLANEFHVIFDGNHPPTIKVMVAKSK